MDTALHFLTAARQCEINELQQLLRTSSLVHAVCKLIHALQKERGLSSIWLASQGTRAQKALPAQRECCEVATQEVRKALDALDVWSLSGGQGARLCSDIAYVLKGLEALPVLRQHVTEQRISVTDSTQAYIRLIAGLLAVVFEAADSATYPPISRLLVAMFHFMQGKELAGQERATGAAAFSSGLSDSIRQQHWLHLIESQERCFQVFADCAPEILVALWNSAVLAAADQVTIERLRRIGCTASPGTPLARDLSEVWFEACTHAMDGMHQIETALAQALVAECTGHLQAVQSQMEQSTMPASTGSPEELPEFFSSPAPSQWDAKLTPQLKESVLQVVQEQSQRLQAMRTELDAVRQALTERKTVERAKGMLMTQQQLSESEAHKLLRQTAMAQNRRIVDVALAVLSMADLLSLKKPSAPVGAPK